MKCSDSLFRKNDLRGVYKKDFDVHFAFTLGRAFMAFARQQKLTIAVGHDSRLSSPALARALAKGLKAAAADVRFLDLTPTPLCFFASHYCADIQASIMVTASHNPPQFNGFKLCLNKETLSGRAIIRLKNILKNKCFLKTKSLGRVKRFNVQPDYTAFMKKNFLDLKMSPFWKNNFIVIDCGSGAGGPSARAVFKALGLKVLWLYDQPDGRFPHHHPDPSLDENLKALQKKVIQTGAVFGVGLDGDADRLVLVGEKGKIFYGDELLALFISDIVQAQTNKARPRGGQGLKTIVSDVKCAPWFYDFLKSHKLKSVMWKSGHSLIRKKTISQKSIFGGEFSGHFFFCDQGYSLDDGVYGALRLMRILARSRRRPEKLLTKIKKTGVKTPGRHTNEIRRPAPSRALALKGLNRLKNFYQKQTLAKVCLIDGVRVHSAHQWGLARLSNTQNVFTFRFGGRSQKDLLNIQNNFYRLLFE